jgi:hypothetical protein
MAYPDHAGTTPTPVLTAYSGADSDMRAGDKLMSTAGLLPSNV